MAYAFSSFLYPLPHERVLRLPTDISEDNGLAVFRVSNQVG